MKSQVLPAKPPGDKSQGYKMAPAEAGFKPDSSGAAS